MPSKTNFRGIYPVLYAFFGSDGRLDRSAMRRQVEGCLAAGVHGIMVLGIATEMNKLSSHERRQLAEWVLEDVNGRLPVAITVPEPNVPDQIAFAKAAEEMGASWVILQPPSVKGVSENELVAFFGKVADACSGPVAVQNNPVNMDVWLSNAGLSALSRNHANITLLKGEGTVLGVRRMIEDTDGAFDVFSGLAGKEITNCLRAGCVGMIPAPDVVDVHVQIYEAMVSGQEELAEELYRNILPLITFVNGSVEQYLCYGKRLVAKRLGLQEVHARMPSVQPTDFGQGIVDRYAASLPAFGGV